MEVNSCQNSSPKRITPWKGVSNSYPKKNVNAQHTKKGQMVSENLMTLSKS